MECMDYAESNMKTEMSPLTSDGEGDSDDDGEHLNYTVKPWKPVKATEAVVLSLCDGAGCAAIGLSLIKVGWERR